jgi:hypothetical protein
MAFKEKAGDFDVDVKTEGEDWALAHGFKPDEDDEGFKGFGAEDANKITLNIGVKFWDEPEDKKVEGLLLKVANAK